MGSRKVVTTVAVALVVSNAAWFVGARIESPSTVASRARAPEPSLLTAPVELRRLAATTITRGDVAPRSATVVRPPASVDGDPVVTAPAPGIGELLREGDRAVEVNGRPVFVLAGPLPAYRTLRPGMSGPDVAQLQAGLRRLGLPADADGTYGPRTTAAVGALYRARGYDPPRAADDEPATLDAAAAALRDAKAEAESAERALRDAERGPTEADVAAADAAVSSAERTLDLVIARGDADLRRAVAEAEAAEARHRRLASDPDTEPDAISEAALERDRTAAEVDLVRRAGEAAVADATDVVAAARAARADLHRAPDLADEQARVRAARASALAAAAALEALERTTGAVVPQGEVVFVPELPARVEARGSLPEAVLTISSGGLHVTTRLDDAGIDALEVGDAAEVLDERSSEDVDGFVVGIARDQTPAADGSEGHLVEIVTAEPLPAEWSGHNVRLTFRAAVTTEDGLVVPLAAVTSGADGRARVERVLHDEVTEQVAVTAGPSADGYIAVEPVDDALRRGDLVVVGR